MRLPTDTIRVISERVKQSFSLRARILAMKSMLWLVSHIKHLEQRFPPSDRLIEGSPPWRHFCLTTRILNPTQTQRLVMRCREERTSVHAAISAAWLRARVEMYPGNHNGARTVSIPVNLRGTIGAENLFGFYMSNAVFRVDCRLERDFWETARDIKNQLNQEIQTGRVYDWLLTMHGVMQTSSQSIRKAVPIFATQPVSDDFSLSNLGKLPLPTHDHSPALSAVYGPAVNTSEQELTVGVSTTCDHLTMTLTYRDYVLPSEKAEKMADRVIDLLNQVVGGWTNISSSTQVNQTTSL